jgi:anion-transporting  ArsA/GET3 family ATPase
MDPASFFRRSGVLLVAGKGGVGKSVTTATMAVLAARIGLRVLVVELEGRPEVPYSLGIEGPLQAEPTLLCEHPNGGQLIAQRIRPDDALVEWLRARSLGAFVKRLRSTGALELVSFAIPGIREVLVLGKLKSIETEGRYDLIVVDAPATGHAMTLLTSPAGLAQAARGGPVRRIADEVVAMLSDPARCRVLLVALPRELAVDETIEAAFEVEDRAGVMLSDVVMNQYAAPEPALATPLSDDQVAQFDPDLRRALEAARCFERDRQDSEATEVARLAAALPLSLLTLPCLQGGQLGPDQIEELADSLERSIRDLEEPL